jgi:hypothetical protein
MSVTQNQDLAMMDHPNIAMVLDAGTTAGGRPCFAMELVERLPITRYCDDQRMTLRQRLELFLPSVRRRSTPTRRGTSTVTCSPRTSSWRFTTACACRR